MSSKPSQAEPSSQTASPAPDGGSSHSKKQSKGGKGGNQDTRQKPGSDKNNQSNKPQDAPSGKMKTKSGRVVIASLTPQPATESGASTQSSVTASPVSPGSGDNGVEKTPKGGIIALKATRGEDSGSAPTSNPHGHGKGLSLQRENTPTRRRNNNAATQNAPDSAGGSGRRRGGPRNRARDTNDIGGSKTSSPALRPSVAAAPPPDPAILGTTAPSASPANIIPADVLASKKRYYSKDQLLQFAKLPRCKIRPPGLADEVCADPDRRAAAAGAADEERRGGHKERRDSSRDDDRHGNTRNRRWTEDEPSSPGRPNRFDRDHRDRHDRRDRDHDDRYDRRTTGGRDWDRDRDRDRFSRDRDRDREWTEVGRRGGFNDRDRDRDRDRHGDRDREQFTSTGNPDEDARLGNKLGGDGYAPSWFKDHGEEFRLEDASEPKRGDDAGSKHFASLMRKLQQSSEDVEADSSLEDIDSRLNSLGGNKHDDDRPARNVGGSGFTTMSKADQYKAIEEEKRRFKAMHANNQSPRQGPAEYTFDDEANRNRHSTPPPEASTGSSESVMNAEWLQSLIGSSNIDHVLAAPNPSSKSQQHPGSAAHRSEPVDPLKAFAGGLGRPSPSSQGGWPTAAPVGVPAQRTPTNEGQRIQVSDLFKMANNSGPLPSLPSMPEQAGHDGSRPPALDTTTSSGAPAPPTPTYVPSGPSSAPMWNASPGYMPGAAGPYPMVPGRPSVRIPQPHLHPVYTQGGSPYRPSHGGAASAPVQPSAAPPQLAGLAPSVSNMFMMHQNLANNPQVAQQRPPSNYYPNQPGPGPVPAAQGYSANPAQARPQQFPQQGAQPQPQQRYPHGAGPFPTQVPATRVPPQAAAQMYGANAQSAQRAVPPQMAASGAPNFPQGNQPAPQQQAGGPRRPPLPQHPQMHPQHPHGQPHHGHPHAPHPQQLQMQQQQQQQGFPSNLQPSAQPPRGGMPVDLSRLFQADLQGALPPMPAAAADPLAIERRVKRT